ncbi:hypothetical protein D3C80_1277940 [compost metagenome]
MGQAGEKFIEVVGRFDLELHAQVLGEFLDQLVFETGFAVAILEVGGRAVAGDHAQHAILLHALEGAGFFNTGTEHQEESGCDEPSGATLAQCSLGKHRCSIRKGPHSPYLDSAWQVC